MITFHSITKIFRQHFWSAPIVALSDISFEIKKGQSVGLLGENGAGKTTLIKILMNFIRPDSGHITSDVSISQIGLLPERPYFYPHLTGREFLIYVGTIRDVPQSELKENIKILSERLKLGQALDRPLKEYSKGMLQRLGIISALIHRPTLLVLDEPLSGLDPIGRKELKEILNEERKKGVTLFFSSHIVSDVEFLCDQLVLIKDHKVSYFGPIDLINPVKEETYTITYLEKCFDQQTKKRISIDVNEKDNFIKSILLENGSVIECIQEKKSLEERLFIY